MSDGSYVKVPMMYLPRSLHSSLRTMVCHLDETSGGLRIRRLMKDLLKQVAFTWRASLQQSS